MIPYDEIRELVARCLDPQMPAAVREVAGRVQECLDADSKTTSTNDPPGLPPLALRKAWSEWDSDGAKLFFSKDGLRYGWWARKNRRNWAVSEYQGGRLEPKGRTWAEVEALAAELKP